MLWSGVVGAQLRADANSGALAGVSGSFTGSFKESSGACSSTGVSSTGVDGPASLIACGVSAAGTRLAGTDALTGWAGSEAEGIAAAAFCGYTVLGFGGVVTGSGRRALSPQVLTGDGCAGETAGGTGQSISFAVGDSSAWLASCSVGHSLTTARAELDRCSPRLDGGGGSCSVLPCAAGAAAGISWVAAGLATAGGSVLALSWTLMSRSLVVWCSARALMNAAASAASCDCSCAAARSWQETRSNAAAFPVPRLAARHRSPAPAAAAGPGRLLSEAARACSASTSMPRSAARRSASSSLIVADSPASQEESTHVRHDMASR